LEFPTRAFGRLACAILASASALPASAQTWPEVAAILRDNCVACHTGDYAPLGLSLDSHAGLVAGSWNGPVIAPGDPGGSELLRRLRGQSEPRMPLDGPPFLEDDQIALIADWVAAGAPHDETTENAAPAPATPPADDGRTTFSDIAPILKQRCIVCHSDNSRYDAPPEGLRLTGLPEVLAGGDRIVVIPGNPEGSELWRRITGVAHPRMPFDGPPWLPDDQIARIRAWIAEGAMDDAGTPAPIPAGGQVRFRGVMTGAAEIDGAAFAITGDTRIDDRPPPGAAAELRGRIAPDGTIVATRLRAR